MKKALFGTSAIAGAAALAAGSAFAGEAPQVTFSGAVAYELQFNDGDLEDQGTGFRIGGNEQQSEFVWNARGTADNGLDYGANVQWRWMRGDRGFDESYVDVRGSFGRIYLGGEDTATDLVGGTSGHSVQVGSWGTDGNNALRSVNFNGLDATLMYYNSAAGMTFDANKIGYVTPDFSGFQAGVSFTPNSANQEQTAGTNNGTKVNVTDVVVGWGGEFSGASIALDLGYQFGTDETATAGGRENISSFQGGGMIGFGGFSVAAGYVHNGDSGCPTLTNNCDDGQAFNVGAAYNFGAGGVSVMYQVAGQNRDGAFGQDEAEIFHVGASYTVAEGMSAYINYYNFDLDNNQAAATVNNQANVVLIGTRVTF